MVLLPARTPTYPDGSLEEVLLHELAHVLVARAAGHSPSPLLVVRPGEEGAADLEVLRMSSIEGTVVDAGTGRGVSLFTLYLRNVTPAAGGEVSGTLASNERDALLRAAEAARLEEQRLAAQRSAETGQAVTL